MRLDLYISDADGLVHGDGTFYMPAVQDVIDALNIPEDYWLGLTEDDEVLIQWFHYDDEDLDDEDADE